MGKEILNRRQNILADSIPPEIVDTSSFIEATDYATSTTGGTLKVDSTYAIELTSGGKLKAKEIAAASYSEANAAAFISKATLDNVLAAQPAPVTGITCDKIITGPVASSSNKTSFTFPTGKSLTDYAFLVFHTANGTDGSYGGCTIVPTAIIPAGGTDYVHINLGGAGASASGFMGSYIYDDGIKTAAGGGAGNPYLIDCYAFG